MADQHIPSDSDDHDDHDPQADRAEFAPSSVSDSPEPPSKRRKRSARRQSASRRRRHFATWQSRLNGQPLATLLLAGLIIGAPQLLGGVLPATVLAITGVSLLCLGVIGLRAPAAARSFPALGFTWLALSVWTVVQGVQLPCGLVHWLAPSSADAAEALRKLLGETNSTCTLSQDPGSTRLEMVKACALFATFTASWFFAASGGRRRLLWIIAISTLAMSVVALCHALFEQDRVFGIYRPTGIVRTLLLAPLMNPNNLGGFAALGVPLWIGLTYRDENANVRLLGYVALALTTTTAVLSLSRGAIGQVLAGGAIMIWFLVRQRGAKQARRPVLPTRELALAIAVALSLGIGAYIVGDAVLRDFTQGKFDKLELGLSALRFAWQHALAGVGRGAFSSAFVGFEGTTGRFRYAENFVAQWAAEWGIPATIALLVAIVLAWKRAYDPARSSLARMGAYTALAGYAAQNLVDFAFELVGVAVVASALLAACVAPSPPAIAAAESDPRTLRRGNVITGLALAASLVLCAFMAPRLRAESLPAIQAELRRSLAANDRLLFSRQLKAALHVHPSEPVLTLMAATEAALHDDPKTLTWLNRSMQLAPGWGQPHQLAFRWLWHRGRGRQALVELKTAATVDVTAALTDVCRLGRVDASWALAAAPDTPERLDFLERASTCIYPVSASADFDAALLHEYPGTPLAIVHESQRMLRAGKVQESLALLEQLRQGHPEFQHAMLLRFETLFAMGHLDELIEEVDRARRGLDEPTQLELLGLKALALARIGTPTEDIREVIAEIRRRSTTDPARLAQSYELEGKVHYELKQTGQALTAYREAFRISGDTRHLRTIAGVAEVLGDRAQALWAYINLCQREPLGDGCERRNALLSANGANSAR
jgi:tetratricopeptide (TPR) repeat protein